MITASKGDGQTVQIQGVMTGDRRQHGNSLYVATLVGQCCTLYPRCSEIRLALWLVHRTTHQADTIQQPTDKATNLLVVVPFPDTDSVK